MEVPFLQFTAAAAAAAPSRRSLLQASTVAFSSSSSRSLNPKFSSLVTMKKTTRISAKAPVPARDRVIDFGRHKGKMLGTLPSSYLNWVSNNLRARDFEEWAKLADDVLNDPVYRDRIEWEFAQRILTGDVPSGSPRSRDSASQLLEISERFGWDNEDKVGWSKVDFGLLGTSKGGRIPRISEKGGVKRESRLKREEVKVSGGEEAAGGGDRRRERRERVRRLKRGGGLRNEGFEFEDDGGDDQVMVGILGKNQDQDGAVENRSRFPGRESLLKKVLNSRERLS